MITHTITENITQSGNSRTGKLVCSCGVETHEEDLRKVSLRVLRAQMAHIHEQVNPETRKVVKLPKPKKSKKQKPALESEPEREEMTGDEPQYEDIEPQVEEPE